MENVLPWPRPPSLAEWRDVALPREHGSWSLALEPLAFGLIAAPSPGGAWLALAVVGAFFARRPLRIAWRDATLKRRIAARGALAASMACSIVAMIAAVVSGGVEWLVWLIPSAIAGGIFLSFDLRNAARKGPAEVAGAVAFALLPGAFAVLGGRGPWESAALAVMMCGRAVPAVLTVRAVLRAAKTGEREVAPALLSSVVALIAGSLFALGGWISWVGPAGLGVLAACSFGLLISPRLTLRARTIGMIEAVLGLGFVIIVALAWTA